MLSDWNFLLNGYYDFFIFRMFLFFFIKYNKKFLFLIVFVIYNFLREFVKSEKSNSFIYFNLKKYIYLILKVIKYVYKIE